MDSSLIFGLIYLIPVVLISLSFHELSHAFVSYRLGDPTAKNLGRITLNPLRHLDPLGTLLLVIAYFSRLPIIGWAKPVPINPSYYRDYKKGTMLVSLAGPLSNILLAFIFSFPMAVIGVKNGVPLENLFNSSLSYIGNGYSPEMMLFNLSSMFFIVNIGLAVFNIIPVPPLDGYKILSGVLPTKQYFKLMQYENYIGIIFMVIVFMAPGLLNNILWPFRKLISLAIFYIVNPFISVLT
jgi:Zn-dependent protease